MKPDVPTPAVVLWLLLIAVGLWLWLMATV